MGKITQEFTELPGIDKKGNPGLILRPVVTFSFNYKRGRILTTNGLLDSGADYNLFPGEYCYGLGINIKRGIPVEIGGIGSRVPLKGYRHFGIKIFFGEYTFETYVDFCMEQGAALLGRNGFLDHFESVNFQNKKGLVTLTY